MRPARSPRAIGSLKKQTSPRIPPLKKTIPIPQTAACCRTDIARFLDFSVMIALSALLGTG
jgi:hypothetical protein